MFLFNRPNVEKLKANHDLQGLIRALGFQNDKKVRSSAAQALGEFGLPAIEPLSSALQDMEADVRENAVLALGRISGPNVINPLSNALKDESGWVRGAAVRAIGEISDSNCIEPLIHALRDKSGSVRVEAAKYLAKIGDTRSIQPLIAALEEDKSLSDRGSLVTALVKLGGLQVMDHIVKALEDVDYHVRLRATEELLKIGDTRAVEPLIKLLFDQNESIRATASEVLGKIGDSRAVDPLIEYLHSERCGWNYYRVALGALERIPAARSKILVIFGCDVEDGSLPVFAWDGEFNNGTPRSSSQWSSAVGKENKQALAWFDAQNFTPIPTFAGEKGAAEYCFDMASQAKTSGNTKEAWAGFHLALRFYLILSDQKMIGVTCLRLGEVYALLENWKMAYLMFVQSAYLANEIKDKKGYAWSHYYLGDVCIHLGNNNLGENHLLEALQTFKEVSPEESPKIEKALASCRRGDKG